MPDLKPDEELFLEAIARREEQAVRRLIDLYQVKVKNIILGMVQHREEAEELTQDVFIEVITAAPRFRGASSLGTWIYRIAVNKSLDHLKKRKRKKRFAFVASLWHDSATPIVDPPDFIHPGILLEKQEASVFFFQALDKLPPNQKSVIVLSALEGLSYEEIGNVMKISVSSVESLLFRARQNLRKTLSYFREDPDRKEKRKRSSNE